MPAVSIGVRSDCGRLWYVRRLRNDEVERRVLYRVPQVAARRVYGRDTVESRICLHKHEGARIDVCGENPPGDAAQLQRSHACSTSDVRGQGDRFTAGVHRPKRQVAGPGSKDGFTPQTYVIAQ